MDLEDNEGKRAAKLYREINDRLKDVASAVGVPMDLIKLVVLNEYCQEINDGRYCEPEKHGIFRAYVSGGDFDIEIQKILDEGKSNENS